jgi:cellulose synthase operon protein C
MSSFNSFVWLTLVAAGSIGGALACGPFFPWQLLDDREQTVGQPIDLGFGFEISRLAPAPRDDLRTVERRDWSQPPDEPEVWAVERKEASSGAWQDLLPKDAARLGPEAFLDRLEKARAAQDGKGALAAGAGLPDVVLAYIAGAVEFRAANLDAAEEYFDAITSMPADKQAIRTVAAWYMQGRVHAIKGEMDAARLAFQVARANARAGAPDPMGLAVASLGEEARVDLIEGRLLESPWTETTKPDDSPQSEGLIAQGIQLYVEQAARGSQIGLHSLRDVAALILADEDLLGRVVRAPVVRHVLVAYVVARDEFGWEDTPSEPAVAGQLLSAVLAQGDPVAGDDIDRLAAVAYRAGSYENAERLTKATSRPLGLWVRAKVELRRGDHQAAVRDWTRALSLVQATRADRDLDQPSERRMRGEAAVAELSVGRYQDSLSLLFPAASTYWGDIAYVAERVLSIDELKTFVDGLPADKAPQTAPTGDDDFRFNDDPAASLRALLARRLMREGRHDEALPYFEAAAKRPAAQNASPDRGADAANARDYVGALEAAQKTWPWQNVTRAEALFKAAKLARTQGMEIMGTEGPPDVAAVGGQFAFGAGQESPQGWRYSGKSDTKKTDRLLGPDEVHRFEASAPRPNQRYHYRVVATDRALAAADLLPQRSQAYAAVLCWATQFATASSDLDRASNIYRRYLRMGAYQAWAKDFGTDCPDPDFQSARTFWLRRLLAGPESVVGSARRHPLAAIGASIVVGALLAGLVSVYRRRRWRSARA